MEINSLHDQISWREVKLHYPTVINIKNQYEIKPYTHSDLRTELSNQKKKLKY
jgi:hypothetical protein